MFVIEAANAHVALPLALEQLRRSGVQRESRNGPVLMFEEPASICYASPTERVMFHPERDANPFFHLFESLWMLRGRNDVAFLRQFVKKIADYSDDGEVFHGAYGHRWRQHFGLDQLPWIIKALRDRPDDRRQVLQMWDAQRDLDRGGGKDLPCNTQAVFSRGSDGALNMTVFNRSNDLVWGAIGANVVHFSILQEFIAAGIGCGVGRYWQISNNLHGYLKTLPSPEVAERWRVAPDPYDWDQLGPKVSVHPLVSTDLPTWERDLALFFDKPISYGYEDPFFRNVVLPMWIAHRCYRDDKTPQGCATALTALTECHASDWRRAAEEWLWRRFAERTTKQERAA